MAVAQADLDLQAMWSTDLISNPHFVEYISEVNYGSLNVPANINVCALLYFRTIHITLKCHQSNAK